MFLWMFNSLSASVNNINNNNKDQIDAAEPEILSFLIPHIPLTRQHMRPTRLNPLNCSDSVAANGTQPAAEMKKWAPENPEFPLKVCF